MLTAFVIQATTAGGFYRVSTTNGFGEIKYENTFSFLFITSHRHVYVLLIHDNNHNKIDRF